MRAGRSIELAIFDPEQPVTAGPTTKYLAEAPQFQNDA
jgi:hypothetical protein